ncbi:phage terminase small subunit [Gordonia tangerina]|uniref:Terminase small subunit n=1 Tax=Gordonia tangerina TaxID=2911060 RepID=A0ABS9DL71_9ACTN|nr:hypothetical protein [Gordonia tangerina]MCF3939906.1 hypothetical protein [Gordonia tangerina]
MPQRKKDPSARARANKASTAATLTDDHQVQCPELPESRDWHPQTLQWWTDLWSAPMATEYHSSDRHALFILAALVDDFWQEPTTSKAAEIRLQRQAFGLTPYDRRRLEWTIETAEESKERGRRRSERSQAPPAAKDDPRSGLYAV